MIPKFRAWDKDKKWMVYDVQDAYDGMWSERNSDEINDYYGYASTFQSFTDEESFNFMQYTGLKDEKGIEIYEDDIVRVTDDDGSTDFADGGIGTVGGMGDLFMWYINGEVQNGLYDIEMTAYIEVIGNKYENPELLEEEE